MGEEVGGGGLIDYKQSRKGDREGPERGEREREREREHLPLELSNKLLHLSLRLAF